jgi:homocitrate synthase NifV
MWLVDTTLRDGEQTPGVVFSLDDKIAIARSLADAGLQELEIGTPAMGEDEISAIQAVTRLMLPCRLTVWCRAIAQDIDQAIRTGAEAIHISLPVSAIQLHAMKKSRTWVLRGIEKMVAYARPHFNYVSIGAQDASRADPAFLARCAKAAQRAGADRLRLADTVGVWNPFQTHSIISDLRQSVPNLAIGFHGHNDLGMATANSVAAAVAGAASVDVTVNGLGERAGNAALEEVVMGLRVSTHKTCGINARRLYGLSTLVAQASGRPIPANKPITGANVFCHESGIHVCALLADHRTYEPFQPEEVGRSERQMVVGKHSGSAAIRHLLADQGIDINQNEAEKLLAQVRTASASKTGPITPEILIGMCST